MIYLDTETCGLHGPIVLIQYAEDDGPIMLHNVWYNPIEETVEIIDSFMNHEGGICGFNLAFDHFHLCQLYTTLIQFPDWSVCPIDYVNQYAEYEAKAWAGPCLKPVTACDLMLHARKGPYQSTMNRNDIRVKRIPTALAWELADELTRRVPLPDIYFERRVDASVRWQVMDITTDLGTIDSEFKDIILKFSPSSALKALAVDALGIKDPRKFFDIEPKMRPEELGYAPFAKAIGTEDDWKGAWPDCIDEHASHWNYNELAKEYAEDDVKYTRMLYKFFNSPQPGDRDSILACMVGAVRWRGFKIDKGGIIKLKTANEKLLSDLDFNYNAPHKCKLYLEEVMDKTEKLVINTSTKAVILEEIAKWRVSTVCDACSGMANNGEVCSKCRGTGLIDTDEMHPAAMRAKSILDARHAKKEIELYDKLLTAGRFFASFNVIGTLSSRMSGGDGLNAQGIKRAKQVRRCFPLADSGLILCGGDFAGFEVVIMDAVYNDPDLHADLITIIDCPICKGKGCDDCKGTGKHKQKIHGLFGMYLFPDMTYEEICASKNAADPWQDYYGRSKNGVFALAYGGEAYTLSNRVGVTEEHANEAYRKFVEKYKKFGLERHRYFDMFCSMRQPGGLGTKVTWADPANYIESLLGFRRYFTLENRICKVLFTLANDPPKDWLRLPIKVVRRDRQQTVCGALQSGLYAAAFALQASNMRAAGNHVIQSTGADSCKELQVRLWTIQPSGINNWRIQPMNIHDEIMAPMLSDYIEQSDTIREQFIKDMSEKIPLIEIEWGNRLNTWADK